MGTNLLSSKKPRTKTDIDPDILASYKPADNYCVINEGDKDLHPVYIPMPECPPLHTIDGYGLSPYDQKFIRQVIPVKLQAIVDQFDTIDEIWNELEENAQEYQEEIKWVRLQILRRFKGYWCFIFGKPTYFTGWNYIYLNFWKFMDGGLPQFRERNRRFFHGMHYAYKTEDAPVYDDNKVMLYRTINVNGVDTEVPVTRRIGARVMFGITYPKNRRDGATNMCLCAEYLETITRFGVISGIISMTGKAAKEHF